MTGTTIAIINLTKDSLIAGPAEHYLICAKFLDYLFLVLPNRVHKLANGLIEGGQFLTTQMVHGPRIVVAFV